jgi:Domain of unknown function (DUF3291)
MPMISITRLRLRSWIYLPRFFIEAMRSNRQASAAEGNLGVRLLPDKRNTFWTATSWSSEAAMRAFVIAAPHGPVMRKLMHWCDEASVVHWEQPDATLPSWEEAHRRLEKEGRLSKVNHPSPAHLAHKYPAPASGRKAG